MIDIGGSVRQVSIGSSHICAVLQAGTLRCWGKDFAGAVLGLQGQLDGIVGDDIDVGGPAASITVSDNYGGCVLGVSGDVTCWGTDAHGHPGVDILGDDESPNAYGPVDVF